MTSHIDRVSALELLLALQKELGGAAVQVLDAQGRPSDASALSYVPLPCVTYDSRQLTPGGLFICKGAAFSPDYLTQAVNAGASCYLSAAAYAQAGVPGIIVADIRQAMAVVAQTYYRHPSQDLDVIALTGTKGKTTVSFYINAILHARAGAAPCALIGGLIVDDGARCSQAHNTTPEALELQRILRQAADNGCSCAVMEASSQGFKYGRTQGTDFAVALFTNIGEDHVSPTEHPNFEDYFASKLKIFDQSRVAVVNLASAHAERVLSYAQAACARVLTYDSRLPREVQEDREVQMAPADVRISSYGHPGPEQWMLQIETPTGPVPLELCALGAFNVGNAVAAVAACEAYGVEHAAMQHALAQVHVPGRMELYRNQDSSVVGIVDYAHNGMSMQALLDCVRAEYPGRQLSVVFGSCGDRGFDRRADLGRVAGSLADRIILTEDEPAAADPEAICEEIGLAVRAAGGTYSVVLPRELAVEQAVMQAQAPAVVVLAGKGEEHTMLRAHGHEPYAGDARLLKDALAGRDACETPVRPRGKSVDSGEVPQKA